MYQLVIDGCCLGRTQFEHGDPPMGGVCGLLEAAPDEQSITGWMCENGQVEDEPGVFRLELSEDAIVLDPTGQQLSFSGGCVIFYPQLGEVHIDLVGVPWEQYQRLFSSHIATYQQRFSKP